MSNTWNCPQCGRRNGLQYKPECYNCGYKLPRSTIAPTLPATGPKTQYKPRNNGHYAPLRLDELENTELLKKITRLFLTKLAQVAARYPDHAHEILLEFRDDIAAGGIDYAFDAWRLFLAIPVTSHVPARSDTRGRPPLAIAPKLIYDTLQRVASVSAAAAELQCSRAYIYKIAGAEKVKELCQVKS